MKPGAPEVRFGVELVSLGPLADVRTLVRLARAAEESGWEAAFIWDHLAFVWGVPAPDPLVALGALAASTERIRLGVEVLVVPRRRPYLLAHALATADVASGGRIVAGVGLGGVVNELAAFGEEGRPAARAAMTDEALGVMTRLWSGEPVTHRGAHYTVRDVRLDPVPAQRPRIPIWAGGERPGALRRAARWDGWVGPGARQDGGMSRTPEDMRSLVDRIAAQRSANGADGSFAVALTGDSGPTLSADIVRPYVDAGVTWWLESIHASRGDVPALQRLVERGPPATR